MWFPERLEDTPFKLKTKKLVKMFRVRNRNFVRLTFTGIPIFNTIFTGDKENRNNRFDGKRVLDARNPQDGPRESREERNNRRNKPETEGGAPRSDDKAPRGGRGGMRGEGMHFYKLILFQVVTFFHLYLLEVNIQVKNDHRVRYGTSLLSTPWQFCTRKFTSGK